MKRSTSILLYVLLPLFWALVLALGFFIYTFNQDPVGLARSGCPPAFPLLKPVLSCRRIKLRSPSFRVPAAALPGLTIRTPGNDAVRGTKGAVSS